jgi:iron complex outermembrane receptor protein
VNQGAYKKSTGKQFNGKAQYQFERGTLTAFADLSRTNQADDAYLSKEMLGAWLGLGGYAPNWQDYVNPAPMLGGPAGPTKCVASTLA